MTAGRRKDCPFSYSPQNFKIKYCTEDCKWCLDDGTCIIEFIADKLARISTALEALQDKTGGAEQ